MVQRKVPNKLGIQADHQDKPGKRLGNLRPPSPQHQDSRNKGRADLKKKMKKSRSIKRSDFESIKSHTFIREVALPGKPPPPPPQPLDVPASASTPQKQSPIRKPDFSPNYMKSTSSFEARKEQSQVSSKSSQSTSIESKSPKKIPNNSKLSSVSGHKPAKPIARASSLKLVRTLTKSPSFKPVRAATKKCAQVVLCEDIEVQRATCSSTLKDSKFPTYLALSPGATESEGTSAMKICPYTYCSLNGHRHAPLPPLKCFLSARRRMLKAQKSMKLGCLSPRRAKASGGGMKEISEEIILDEKPAIQEMDSNGPAINPMIQEEDQMDFFVEIYAGVTEDAAGKIGISKEDGDGQEEIDFAADEDSGGKVVESCSNEAQDSVIDSEDNLGNSGEVVLPEMEAAEEAYSPSVTQVKIPECFRDQSDFELDGTYSETSDMEWEEGQYSAPSPDDEVGYSAQTNNKYDSESGSSFGDDNPCYHEETVFKSDDVVRSHFDEMSADEGTEEFTNEDVTSSGAGCSDNGSDSEGSCQNLGSDDSFQGFTNQNYLVSLTYDAFEESTAEEIDGNTESDDFVDTLIALAPIEEPIEELREAWEGENKVAQADGRTPITNLLLGFYETEFSSNITEPCHDEMHEGTSDDSEVCQTGGVRGQTFAESLLPKTKDQETKQTLKQELSTADARDGVEDFRDGVEEKDREEAAKSLIRIPSFNLLQGSSEADQDMTKEDDDEVQFSAADKDGVSNQAFVDEDLPADTQVHTSNKESQSNNIDEQQNHTKKDHREAQSFKISDSMDTGDQTHSGLNKVTVVENSNEDGNGMELEYSTMSEPEGSLLSTENAASTQAKTAFSRGLRHPSEELPKATNNIKIIRCKRPAEELEEPKEFNPREPNYLPVEPDPEAEKVDLRHQMIDERKNAEEWMLDYALQQAVTKLAPARKRKVALLVEAFEKVIPIPKYEAHPRHTSTAFAHSRPIQACR